MKLIFDQPEIMKRAAIEMSNQGAQNDWRNSIRQFKILDAFSYNFKEQADVSKQVLINYKKLITTTQDREEKLDYFERSVLEIAKLYQLNQNDKEIKFNLQENLEQVFQLLGSLNIQGFERLFTEEFKFNFELNFSTDYLLQIQNQITKGTRHKNFLEKPQNLYDKLIQMVQELMKTQNNFKDNINIQNQIASQQPMPKLLYLSSNKMNKKINDTEYFKFTEKVNQKFAQGKQQFLNFLIDNIEIKINGIIIHKLNQQDLELYEQDIINFFLLNDFNDSSDKEIMNFIKNKLKKL